MARASRMMLGVLPLLAACYTQAPLGRPVPLPDQRIVAQISDTGVVAMGNVLGPGAQEVEGIVAGADATSWDLRMVRVNYRGGSSVLWNQELVRFPRSALTRPTERRFSKARSWIFAGLVTSSALLAARFLGMVGGGDNRGNPEPPPN